MKVRKRCKGSQGRIRTNISIPADLHATMLEKIPNLNWSALACAAFRKAICDLDNEDKMAIVREVAIQEVIIAMQQLGLL